MDLEVHLGAVRSQERLHGHSSTIAACHLLVQLPHIGGPGKQLRACVVGAVKGIRKVLHQVEKELVEVPPP